MKKIKVSLKQRWINYLNRLGKVNENLYGKQRLDCCDLEKKNKTAPHLKDTLISDSP